jgi:GrpB-like predicted nucleotidyltransferase (UPF0157 family)
MNSTDAAVHILNYDPAWPGKFELERLLLQDVLHEWLTGPIEHVGSTAVSGLAAKPVIDIMAAVESLKVSAPAKAALAVHGYQYFPYKDDVMHWFCKPSAEFRTHHLHLVPFDSNLWRERIVFRNALRSNRELALEYEALKRVLAEAHRNDREAYSEAKWPFVKRVLEMQRTRGETAT